MAAVTPLRVAPDRHAAPRPPSRPLPPGCVRRPRLVERLIDSRSPLVVVDAPLGYGKTILLKQWEEEDERPFVWVTLAAADNDPVHLVGAIPQQLGEPMVVVLDDAHLLRSGPARSVLATLAEHTPDGSTLAIASRGTPLRLGRLRATGLVTEIGAADLAMTDGEATTFLARTALGLTAAETETVVRRVEGWPAGLRLAERSLRDRDGRPGAVARFSGDDHIVAGYLRDELLAEVDDGDLAFLTESSLLGLLSGPLCDAVLQRAGSERLLRELADANVLLSAVDRAQERFRMHGMLADTLRLELRRTNPGLAAAIHGRAADWHEGRHEIAAAIDHATAAGDAGRAGRLLLDVAPAHIADARPGALGAWLERFADADILAHPELAGVAALVATARGDREAAERWLEPAERPCDEAGPKLAAAIALVHASLAREGVDCMARHAARAHDLAEPGSPVRASAALFAGVAHALRGAGDAARPAFEEGARRRGSSLVEALCLAQLALLAIEDGDGARGDDLAGRARGRLAEGGEAGAALVLAVAALASALGGAVADARRDARDAKRLLDARPDVPAWSVVQTRIVLARAELRLSDAAAARDLLEEAQRGARAIPDATALHAALADAWEQADAFAVGAVAGPTSLTTAELRVLRFLPSHLSFREIAARLHVSANTVKTQAHAIYRKLDASSRSEAVARARAVGLVDG